MSNIIFSPGEKVILSGKGRVEQPIRGEGELYLTNKRIVLIHRTGLIRKRETPLVDIRLDQISYAKVEGLLSKVLVIGIPQGGTVIAYKIKVSNPDSWLAAIYSGRQ
ncbi:hypothetical protein [Infirmifilum sp.]|uniref:hypothetical protein n=1 Tax=Infirmifilum sp. TaxID=2856575 RepID=UPI003D11B01F